MLVGYNTNKWSSFPYLTSIPLKIKRNRSLYNTEFLSDESSSTVMATTSLKMTNRPLSKLKSEVSHGDHKRT